MSGLYSDLGVPRNADKSSIKRAYQKRAQKDHPDKGGNGEKFYAIQRAYDVLSDDGRRARYDQTGEAGDQQDLRAQMMSSIAELMLQLIDAVDVDHTDIVAAMRQHVAKRRADILSAKGAHETKIRRRRAALKRLKRKSGGPNLMAPMIEADIAANERSIDDAEVAALQMEEILKVIAEYEYSADAKIDSHSAWTTFTVTS